jgi:hypothetical protein
VLWYAPFEKYFENAFPNARSAIHNLRLGSINSARWLQKIVATCDAMSWFFWDAMILCNNFMPPKRRFWKDEQKMKCWISIDFSMVCSPNRVLKPLKSTSKCAFHLLFWFPKSSFGRHKLCKMITKDSSNMWCADFHGMLWSFVTTLQDDYKR